MRLFYEPFGLELPIESGVITWMCIESPLQYRQVVENLYEQWSGKPGDIKLTECDREIKWEKEIAIISNPFQIDLNERKILTCIHKDFAGMMLDEQIEAFSKINSEAIQLLDSVEKEFPYPVDYNVELDPLALLKMYALQLNIQTDNLAELIIEYVKLSHRVLGTQLFVFFNLVDFFTTEELLEISKSIAYENVSFLVISGKCQPEMGKIWIMDSDQCIIEI